MELWKLIKYFNHSKDSNLPIDLGLWIGGDLQENNLEIQRALEILKEYPNENSICNSWKMRYF